MHPEDDFEERLASICPDAAGRCERKSPRTTRYNCIAWAVRDETKPWYPKGDPKKSRWPADAPASLDLAFVVETFERLGFEVCPPDDVEVGFERIAFFEDTDGTVSHAARQLPDGRWTSKLGTWEDVEHDTLECLEGEAYGKVAKLLRKKLD